MRNKHRVAMACCLLLGNLAGSALAEGVVDAPRQTTPFTVFEGRLLTVGVTPGCGTAAFVGDRYTSVFRPKFLVADPAESITLVAGSGASILTSGAVNGRIVNSPAVLTSFNGTLISSRAALTTWSSTATLLKTPPAVGAATIAVIISGTIDNFNLAGCTVTVRGAYARRP